MKKIKFFTLALLATVVSLSFVSCGDDDNDKTIINNYSKYLSAVTSDINANKKSDKAILLVAFGSTWQNAFEAFDATKAKYQEEFKDYDVYISFSSAICFTKAAEGEHVADGAEIRNYYPPESWLEGLGRAKYSEIIVQSLQVIPGEEYARVKATIKDFLNDKWGDLGADYLSEMKLYLGEPLMKEEEDVDSLAKYIDKNFKEYRKNGEAILLMGHGNPDGYDNYGANNRYTQLEEKLQSDYYANYYVGTVDMPNNYKEEVLARMKADGFTSGTFRLHALMSIAGDHAHNDMGDKTDDGSWLGYFQSKGYGYSSIYNNNSSGNEIFKGLLEIEDVRQLWINHTKNAQQFNAAEE